MAHCKNQVQSRYVVNHDPRNLRFDWRRWKSDRTVVQHAGCVSSKKTRLDT
jgi:hypothetical protein